CYAAIRYLLSFPTRRSSDLMNRRLRREVRSSGCASCAFLSLASPGRRSLWIAHLQSLRQLAHRANIPGSSRTLPPPVSFERVCFLDELCVVVHGRGISSLSGHEIPLRGFVDGAALMEHEPEIVQCLSFTVWGGAPQPSLSFGW